MVINNVQCDIFAFVDEDKTSGLFQFSLSQMNNMNVVVYLYADRKPFPVSNKLTAECCIKKDNYEARTISCSIGDGGEIIVPIESVYRLNGNVLHCEINISGVDSKEKPFRFKAATFVVAITE